MPAVFRGATMMVAALAVITLASPATSAPCVPLDGLNDRCPIWTATYHPPGVGGFSVDEAADIVADPLGRFVIVTGMSWGSDESRYDAATIAYDPNGVVVWASRYAGPSRGGEFPHAAGMSADGTRVFVTGERFSEGPQGSGDGEIFTVAYDAATGAELWSATHDGPEGLNDRAVDVAVAPDGSEVFVAGTEDHDPGGGSDVVPAITLAYGAETGEEIWLERYRGEGSPDGLSINIGFGVEATHDRVLMLAFTTGRGDSPIDVDHATIAYARRTEDGEPRLEWTARFDGPARSYDEPLDLRVSPDGRTVYTVGSSFASDAEGREGYQTTAYDTVTGEVRWSDRYRGTAAAIWALPTAMELSPDGSRLYVTGLISGRLEPVVGTPTYEWGSVAYDTQAGTRLWEAIRGTPARLDQPTALGVSPSGGAVYVAGTTRGILDPAAGDEPTSLTVAYTSGGQELWVAAHDESGARVHPESVSSMAVLPSGRIVVAGALGYDVSSYYGIYSGTAGVDGPGNISDFHLLAY